MAHGERVLPISQMCVNRTDRRGLLLGFGSDDDAALARSAKNLAAALRGPRA
jgi:hypothetical protein